MVRSIHSRSQFGKEIFIGHFIFSHSKRFETPPNMGSGVTIGTRLLVCWTFLCIGSLSAEHLSLVRLLMFYIVSRGDSFYLSSYFLILQLSRHVWFPYHTFNLILSSILLLVTPTLMSQSVCRHLRWPQHFCRSFGNLRMYSLSKNAECGSHLGHILEVESLLHVISFRCLWITYFGMPDL